MYASKGAGNVSRQPVFSSRDSSVRYLYLPQRLSNFFILSFHSIRFVIDGSRCLFIGMFQHWTMCSDSANRLLLCLIARIFHFDNNHGSHRGMFTEGRVDLRREWEVEQRSIWSTLFPLHYWSTGPFLSLIPLLFSARVVTQLFVIPPFECIASNSNLMMPLNSFTMRTKLLNLRWAYITVYAFSLLHKTSTSFRVKFMLISVHLFSPHPKIGNGFFLRKKLHSSDLLIAN